MKGVSKQLNISQPLSDVGLAQSNLSGGIWIYLREYFGEPPNEYPRARFYLMQQVAHMFYAMAFLTLGSSGEPIDWSEPLPEYSDYQRRFWAREVPLADNQAKTVYGRLHLEQLSQNMREPRFEEALKIVNSTS